MALLEEVGPDPEVTVDDDPEDEEADVAAEAGVVEEEAAALLVEVDVTEDEPPLEFIIFHFTRISPFIINYVMYLYIRKCNK